MTSSAASAATATPPEPGIYRGVDFDTYVAWEAVNSSTLNGFARTPAHVYHEMTHGGKERTEALDRGWLLHLAALEPERFQQEVVVAPKVDKRTNVGKATWAQFEAEHPGAYVVDDDTHANVLAMAKSLRTHPTAAEFLAGRGQNELSLIWEDQEHGVRCKSRLDRVSTIGEWPIIGDLKSTWNASRRAFEKSVERYGYDVQAVHYVAGLDALVRIPDGVPYRRFVHFVVESEPPHCVAVYELDDATLEEGRVKRSRYLRKWRECVESGRWHGYPAGIESASLPAWAFRNYVDE